MDSNKDHEKNSTSAILAQLQDMASAVMYAAEARDLEVVLERIAQATKDLVNVKYAALGVPDDKDGLRYFKVAGMTAEAIARLDHLPKGHGLLGVIQHDQQALRLEHMRDDPRSSGFCHGHPHMGSLLGVPILVGNQLFGILYLCDRLDGKMFTTEDQALVEMIAGYAALAIAGSEFSEQKHRLTLLEERQRISMELHDGVIQSLYAVGMHLDLLRLNGNASPDELKQTIQSLNSVIDDIRRYIMDLRRGDQRQQTIRESLEELVKRLHVGDYLKITVDAPNEISMFSPTTFEAICQMTQEALSNAIRHADATTIAVVALQNNDALQITVSDNGTGFELDQLAENKGLGLRNIQQRATLHGGRVYIETEPDNGTRLTISVPIPKLT